MGGGDGDRRGENWVHIPGDPDVPLVLVAEHAGAALPSAPNLGIPEALLTSHWGTDIGVGPLARGLAERLRCALVHGVLTRLAVDLNRSPVSPDLFRAEAGGLPIPGNRGLTPTAVADRIARWYDPYHVAVDRAIEALGATPVGGTPRRARGSEPAGQPRSPGLISLHSFTPILAPRPGEGVRAYDVGVLYDRYPGMAQAARDAFRRAGLRTELNRPYSGERGFMFSASTHGKRYDIPYFEVEVNNLLLRKPVEVGHLADLLADIIRTLPRFPALPVRA